MRVAVHFHPDWPYAGATVMEALARDGVYRTRWETGTSNGGLTAHPGGDRWRWESRLFAGRYGDGPPAQRPVYGAVCSGEAYGASPRFGSAYLRLRAEVGERSTYCFPDSVFEPTGTVGPEGVADLVALCAASDLRLFDRYVEAHVHGGVRLDRDVEAIVLDPSMRDSPAHAAAEEVAAVEWHPGYRHEGVTSAVLEKGSPSAGLQHILERHEQEFLTKGITRDQIPDLIRTALTEGKVVGTQGASRTIYEVEFERQTVRVAVQVGENGYVVSANPRSIR